jgi:hypothetical protein
MNKQNERVLHSCIDRKTYSIESGRRVAMLDIRKRHA